MLQEYQALKIKCFLKKKPIEIIELKDLKDTNRENYGYPGSATRVKSMFVPKITRSYEILSGTSSENADIILEKLSDWEEIL